MAASTNTLLAQLNAAALEINPASSDYAPLLKAVTDKDFILLGESTHGSQEFYQARADITQQLILNNQLSAIAVEGDWPSVYRVNRFVRWQGVDKTATQALADFTRFPMWMWRNTVVKEFVQWLRGYNKGRPFEQQVGFYGLDMYSLYESVAQVLNYLDDVDPEAAKIARRRYGCLNHDSNEQQYGYGVKLGYRPSCEEEVVKQLVDLRKHAEQKAVASDNVTAEGLFQIEQNARLIKSAESYYRQMFSSNVRTWNLRDSHMFETLQQLRQFLSNRSNRQAKIVVWAHNSHLGDATATSMGQRGEHNLGQLVRQHYRDRSILIGLTTSRGTVTAASEWDGEAEFKNIVPSINGSIEHLLHQVKKDNFFLQLNNDLADALSQPLLQRAIGVLYLPDSERSSHYFYSHVARQFDAILHIDQTSALQPLDKHSETQHHEPETYPFGL